MQKMLKVRVVQIILETMIKRSIMIHEILDMSKDHREKIK